MGSIVKQKKILFVMPYCLNRVPSQRFRFEQYLGFLRDNGFLCRCSYLLSENDEKHFYSKGRIFVKGLILLKHFFIRFFDLLQANNYDIIFVHRESFFIGPALFEFFFRHTKAKIIFDFDDAVWLANISRANERLAWLKNSRKTAKIISYADAVFCGNKYLADFSKKFNDNVFIVPTTINTEVYRRAPVKKPVDKVCIGWSGSVSTIQHFEFAVDFLLRLKGYFGEKVFFKVIGDGTYFHERLGIRGISWSRECELEELSYFDIGIMPLPDDEWSRGKCGLKGLQYMALKIPTVMSAVGVNTEIINDGVNGFLARNQEEWFLKISKLVESGDLRRRIGEAGFLTVSERYSFNSQKDRYLSLFNKLVYRR